MSRHRNLKNMIDEAYEEEYGQDVDYGIEEDELHPDDNEIVNEVWDTVGNNYEKHSIIEALDEVDWVVDDAINLLLVESKRFAKKKGPAKKKDSKDAIKTAPKKDNLPTMSKETSKEEAKETVLKKKDSTDLTPFRKESEDLSAIVKENSKFIDKSKFNNIIPEIPIPPKVESSIKESKNLYVVVCGHVDSGKSTLVGHLLVDLGMVQKQTMHKFEKESTDMGKGSFKYAWVMDERTEERQRGVTIEVGIKQIETKNKNVILLDAPGHQDYVSNMIGGTAQADVALLVVDSISGAFDAGFNRGGQTQEHAILARSMGIESIIVAVNKLDVMHWSKDRFEYISSLVTPFLEEIGYKQENITILPISGLQGDNVFQRSKRPDLGWYDGPSIIEILDGFKLTPKNIKKPLRMVVNSVYQSTTGQAKGLCFSGKVEAGILEKGSKYIVMPSCGQATIKDVFVDDQKANFAIPGDNVVLVVQAKEFDIANFRYGSILCHWDFPMPVAVKFTADIEVFDFERPLIRGERSMIFIGLTKISTVLTKIHHTLKKETGEILKKNPKLLKKGDFASVEIMCERPTAVELFKNYPLLGRIILREKEKTIASGIIKEILD